MLYKFENDDLWYRYGEFENADLDAVVEISATNLNNAAYSTVPWDALTGLRRITVNRGVFPAIAYAGRYFPALEELVFVGRVNFNPETLQSFIGDTHRIPALSNIDITEAELDDTSEMNELIESINLYNRSVEEYDGTLELEVDSQIGSDRDRQHNEEEEESEFGDGEEDVEYEEDDFASYAQFVDASASINSTDSALKVRRREERLSAYDDEDSEDSEDSEDFEDFEDFEEEASEANLGAIVMQAGQGFGQQQRGDDHEELGSFGEEENTKRSPSALPGLSQANMAAHRGKKSRLPESKYTQHNSSVRSSGGRSHLNTGNLRTGQLTADDESSIPEFADPESYEDISRQKGIQEDEFDLDSLDFGASKSVVQPSKSNMASGRAKQATTGMPSIRRLESSRDEWDLESLNVEDFETIYDSGDRSPVPGPANRDSQRSGIPSRQSGVGKGLELGRGEQNIFPQSTNGYPDRRRHSVFAESSPFAPKGKGFAKMGAATTASPLPTAKGVPRPPEPSTNVQHGRLPTAKISAQGRDTLRDVEKIASDIQAAVCQHETILNQFKKYTFIPCHDEESVDLFYNKKLALNASSESITVYKGWTKGNETDLAKKALIILGSLGIPPCPQGGIHVDNDRSELGQMVMRQYNLIEQRFSNEDTAELTVRINRGPRRG